MVWRPDGTWIERVDGSAPEPSDLYCCYNCSEQLEPPLSARLRASEPVADLDDTDDDAPTDATSIYLLLRNKLVVYAGIGLDPLARMQEHRDKGWGFDEMIETDDSPYCRAEAERREKILIPCFRPEYNQQHRFRRITKEEEREFLVWLARWPEGTDAMCARIERLMRIDLALRAHAYPLF
jgi:hypothetical protein